MKALLRSDLPANRKLRSDILLLEESFGNENVFWDKAGRWLQINRFWLRSTRFEFNFNPIYVLAFVPDGYGERRGNGSGIEEFYVPEKLRMRRIGGAWQTIPNTHSELDRRGGQVLRQRYRYACVHIVHFDPKKHDIRTSLTALQLLLTDPEAFT